LKAGSERAYINGLMTDDIFANKAGIIDIVGVRCFRSNVAISDTTAYGVQDRNQTKKRENVERAVFISFLKFSSRFLNLNAKLLRPTFSFKRDRLLLTAMIIPI